MTDTVRSALEAAGRYLTEHPDEARYTDSVATARLEGGLQVRVEGPAGELLQTDMPAGVGGGGTHPSPGWFLRAAAAACVASLAAMRAAQLGIDELECQVEVDSVSDDRGILGLDGSVPAGPISARIRLTMAAPGAGLERLQELGAWAVDHCPVSDGLRRAIPVQVEVSEASTARD